MKVVKVRYKKYKHELLMKTREYAKELDAIIMGSIALAHLLPSYNMFKDGDLLARECKGTYITTVQFGKWNPRVYRIEKGITCAECPRQYDYMLKFTKKYGKVRVYDPNAILSTKLPKIGLALATDIRASLFLRMEAIKSMADSIIIFYYLDYSPRIVAELLYELKLVDTLNYIFYNMQNFDTKLATSLAKYHIPEDTGVIEQVFFDNIMKIREDASRLINGEDKN